MSTFIFINFQARPADLNGPLHLKKLLPRTTDN